MTRTNRIRILYWQIYIYFLFIYIYIYKWVSIIRLNDIAGVPKISWTLLNLQRMNPHERTFASWSLARTTKNVANETRPQENWHIHRNKGRRWRDLYRLIEYYIRGPLKCRKWGNGWIDESFCIKPGVHFIYVGYVESKGGTKYINLHKFYFAFTS